MVQLLQANCLALGPCLAPNLQREGCVHERMWMWLALFARLFLFPPKTRRGSAWWMRSSAIFVRMHTNSNTPTNTQAWAHTRLHWFNLMMGIGGEIGICEGQKSLNSNTHHCRLQPVCLLHHCHYHMLAHLHYQLTSSNTLHYQLVLNGQMGWTLKQMTG